MCVNVGFPPGQALLFQRARRLQHTRRIQNSSLSANWICRAAF